MAEEDWQKKNREADERKKVQEKAQQEKEAKEIEAEVAGLNKIQKKKTDTNNTGDQCK